MKKKSNHQSKRISNRRARFDYALDDALVVGIVLNGRETKALRLGQGSLQGAYVTVNNGELWLIGAQIMGGKSINIEEHERSQSRKLLAKRKEIARLIAAKQQGLTIVPMELLTQGRYIKLRIAAGRGKKQYDKRQVLKKRDAERSVRREQ